jgi:hypothetical protein
MCKTKKNLYAELAGKELLKYCKKNNIKLEYTNYLSQVTGSSPYVAIYYDNGDGTETIYLGNKKSNLFCATYGDQLLINDNPKTIGQARYVKADMGFSANLSASRYPQYPLYKDYVFSGNTNIYQTFKKTGILTKVDDSYYNENSIERWTTWVYYPSTTVYCLINKNPLKIYVMQNYSNDVDTTINYSNLSLLANKLKLPDNFIFAYLTLDKDTYLTAPSNGKAIVVSDEYQNSYMYVQPKSAKWLYSVYDNF